MALPLARTSVKEVLGQILFAILVFSDPYESCLSSFFRLFDHFFLKATLIVVVANSMNSFIAVRFVLKKVMSWEPIAQLVRVWPFIKDHLQDWPYEKSVVTATADHVRPFRQLVKLLLSHFLRLLLLELSPFISLIAAIISKFLVRDV